ncbi:SDR family NAD(P)-dependent oxidoreductase, partial [Xanthomonas hortorum pv. vitians]|nr:SDR family NAD(P)-dependent oxidoreductase [Xanthomonas hortorum pv. vitians]
MQATVSRDSASLTASVAALAAHDSREGHPMRSILITGAGSGIGAGIATELAAAGHHLIVSDMDLAAAERTARTLRDAGGS